jgi:phosphomannomutase
MKLRETLEYTPTELLCLAGDLRPSTGDAVELEGKARGRILQAVAHAIREAGLRPVYLGRIPAPALMHYAIHRGLASIMVTGSHIPFDRNGIKFNKPTGEVLKSDEPQIIARVQETRAREYDRPAAVSPFGPAGMLTSAYAHDLPPVQEIGRDSFMDRYLEAFPAGVLRGRRILVYQHSAVGRDLLVELLNRLGAEAIPARRTEEFIPIDTEAVDDVLLEQLQDLANAHEPRSLDAVVSTDGDSDRPLLLGLEQGRVRFFSGDLVGMVTAEFLGARQVVVPISANDAVDLFFGPAGVEVIKTRIGSPHVIAALREVGWEANGGFLTAAPSRVPGGGTLQPLPTRDAFLPLLATLYASLGRGLTVCECFTRLPPRFNRSAVLRPFPAELNRHWMALVQPDDTGIETVHFGDDNVRLRSHADRNESVAEPGTATELESRRALWQSFFPTRDGFAPIRWFNFLDGVRTGFANGEIIHVRPSGNAPELRVYANADSQARADQLVRQALAPAGPLHRLTTEAQLLAAVDRFRQAPCPLELRGVVRHYAWGGTRFIPGLLGLPAKASKPHAELWFGAHPSAPASTTLEARPISLQRLIQLAPVEILGPSAVARHGPQLPFLLKVLDAREMLSVQVHPDLAQAQAGFERENAAGLPLDAPGRNYKDPYPKPELHVPLTRFWMLHGFRRLENLAELLSRVPELALLLPDLHAQLRAAGPDRGARADLLRRLYESAMTLPQAEVDTLVRLLLKRLARAKPSDPAEPDYWVLRAGRRWAVPGKPCDRGLFSIYLLNLVQLEPGQATFQTAGVPHAYLEGTTVELMANSDNVLRGGLTDKHVDVRELLRVVRFEEGLPEVIQPRPLSDLESAFSAPTAGLELRQLQLPVGTRFQGAADVGPECLLVMEGTAILEAAGQALNLERGGAALIPAGLAFGLVPASPGARLFRARLV